MLLDSSAWIELFEGSAKGRQVEALLLDNPGFASAVSYAEIWMWAIKNRKDADAVIQKLEQIARILPVGKRELIGAAVITLERKKTHPKWGLADAIIYMTAKVHGLELLSADHDFKGLENAIVID